MRPFADPRTAAPRAAGALTGARVLWGSALLLAPGAMLGEARDAQTDRRARTFARVLGARQLAQAALVAPRGSRDWVILAGAAVDAAHAATMVALAVLDRTRRKLALTNAFAATAFALAGAREAHRG